MTCCLSLLFQTAEPHSVGPSLPHLVYGGARPLALSFSHLDSQIDAIGLSDHVFLETSHSQ